MKKEITVQELINLLNSVENKNLPIDILISGCWGKQARRYKIIPEILQHHSDVKNKVGALSLKGNCTFKDDLDCAIVDDYEPLAKSVYDEVASDLDDEDKDLLVDLVECRRKTNQMRHNKTRNGKQ